MSPYVVQKRLIIAEKQVVNWENQPVLNYQDNWGSTNQSNSNIQTVSNPDREPKSLSELVFSRDFSREFYFILQHQEIISIGGCRTLSITIRSCIRTGPSEEEKLRLEIEIPQDRFTEYERRNSVAFLIDWERNHIRQQEKLNTNNFHSLSAIDFSLSFTLNNISTSTTNI